MISEERIKELVEKFCGTYTVTTAAGTKTVPMMQVPKWQLPEIIRTVAAEANNKNMVGSCGTQRCPSWLDRLVREMA